MVKIVWAAGVALALCTANATFAITPPRANAAFARAVPNVSFEARRSCLRVTSDDIGSVPASDVDVDDDTGNLSTSTFKSLGLAPDILQAVRYQGWAAPTPIQRLVIPKILDFDIDSAPTYDSIWSEAPTGSGKTGAFALPLVQTMLRQKRNRALIKETLCGRVATLVLCPTRELALQIGNVIEEISEALPRGRSLDVVAIYGGVPLEPQIDALAKRRKSGAGLDILVATPGRLVDVLRRSEKDEPTEAALERRLLDALDATGRVDAQLSLAQIQDMNLDRVDDDGRASIADMLDGLKFFVMDEADRLLGQAFKSEMDSVLELLPSPDSGGHSGMKTLLFSATFPEQIQPRIEKVLHRLSGNDVPPLRLSCSYAGMSPLVEAGEEDGEEISNRRQKRLAQTTKLASVLEGPASTIDMRTIRIDKRDRTQALRHLIETNDWDRVLVFVSTRYSSEHVARKLRRANIKSTELHGKLDQDARTRRLQQFKAGKTRVLIATDLASRGLDVVGLPAVVNYDLPRSTTDFTHRIGRTGRAGKRGTAISFVTPVNEAHFNLIERRHFNGRMGVPRETLEKFEPDEENWRVQSAAAKLSRPGVQHSKQGLVHDRMHGGVKGRRKSKKDKLREAAARKQQQKGSR